MTQSLFHKKTIELSSALGVAGTLITESFTLERALGLCAVIQIEVQSPANVVFDSTEFSNSRINMPLHGLKQGLEVRLTSTGTLPTGLSAGVSYFVADVDAESFKLAASKSDSLQNTTLSFSDGTGEHTITAQPFGSLKCYLEGSIDNEAFQEIPGSMLQASGNKNLLIEYNEPLFKHGRFKLEVDSGQVNVTTKVLLKGNF